MNTTNLILWLITFASSTVFLAFLWLKYGVQSSISASVKVLQGPVEISYYSWFIVTIVFPMLIMSDHWTGRLAAGLLLFDAAAISIQKEKNKIQYYLHNFGAMGGMGFGMVQVVHWNLWYLIPVGLWLLFTGYCMMAEWLWKNDIRFWMLRSFIENGYNLSGYITFFKPIPNHTTWIEFSAMLIIFPVYFIRRVIL